MTLRVALLGATGSIGSRTVEVIRAHRDRLELVAVASRGSDPGRLLELARDYPLELLAVSEPAAAAWLRPRLPAACRLATGPESLLEVASLPAADRVVAGVVGAAGLPAVAAALRNGKIVALANKESLVVAGAVLMRLAELHGGALVPVDSEHCALHQALRTGRAEEISRLVLTASGGPFRTRDLATFPAITAAEAVQHPTWAMGPKISVDSATLVNKALELIEAHHLFGVPPARLDAVIHPQSIVHSLVEWRDGHWIAQLAPNDMVHPIGYALAYPERWETPFPRLEPERLGQLEFHPVEPARYPALRLGRAALEAGGSAPAVFNAANEVAVQAFLAGEIPFPAIPALLETMLERHKPRPLASLEEALEVDSRARQEARALLSRTGSIG